jgi:hypothetical protein
VGWCVKTAASTNHNCSDGHQNSYIAGTLEIVSNSNSGASVRFIPLQDLNNANIDINMLFTNQNSSLNSSTMDATSTELIGGETINTIVQPITIENQIDDGSSITIPTGYSNHLGDGTAPRLVPDGGNCASADIANSITSYANESDRISGIITVEMEGGTLTSGDYELCFKASGN